jgi:hypothetical protein
MINDAVMPSTLASPGETLRVCHARMLLSGIQD